jgi:hypothetical protein
MLNTSAQVEKATFFSSFLNMFKLRSPRSSCAARVMISSQKHAAARQDRLCEVFLVALDFETCV